MTLYMLIIAMFVGILSVGNWVHGVQEEKECWSKLRKLKNTYDDLFSYQKGRFFLLKGIVMEIVEVGTQTQQLLRFSPERPLEWIVGLSVLLVLNGIMMPIPFAMQKWFPKLESETKLFLSMIDVAFDIGCIVITVAFRKTNVYPRCVVDGHSGRFGTNSRNCVIGLGYFGVCSDSGQFAQKCRQKVEHCDCRSCYGKGVADYAWDEGSVRAHFHI